MYKTGKGLIAGVMFLAVGIAHADVFTFDFNLLKSGKKASGGKKVDSSIQNYMNSVLGAEGSVKVTGAVTDQKYNGDDHAVGPTRQAALTLGTSDGATDGTTPTPTGSLHPLDNNGNQTYDTFIRNVAGTSSFTLQFSGIHIFALSFDFEIFPDGTCAKGNASGNCGSNWPDFTFLADGNTVFHYYGVMPGKGTSSPGAKSVSGTPGYSSYSASPASATELAPQLLGVWSGSLGADVTTLTFQDWPATIGIDNLVIVTNPEPSALILLGTAVAGAFWLKRKRRRA